MNKKLNLSWGLVKTNNGLPWWLRGKETACNVGDAGSIPGSGIFPGGGNGNPLQYSCWEILLTEEPGRLQSMGSQRIRHNLATKQHICNKPIFEKKTKARGWETQFQDTDFPLVEARVWPREEQRSRGNEQTQLSFSGRWWLPRYAYSYTS